MRLIITAAVFTLACCLGTFRSFAQEKVINGSVKSAADSAALPFAIVQFKKDSSLPASYYTLADAKGRFSISIPAQVHSGWLVVTSVGYQEKIITVDLSANHHAILIHLEKNITELPQVTIKTEPAIKVTGDTIAYRVNAFKMGNEKKLDKLIANVPGFQINDNGRILYNGQEVETVLIEGDNLTDKNYEKLISNLDVNGIEKLEIIKNYKDAGNLLSQFNTQKKLALNIKYDKAYLAKIFGTIEEGLAMKGYYNSDLQVISLFNKVKLLGFQANNSFGSVSGRTDDVSAANSPDKNDLFLFEPEEPQRIASASDNRIRLFNQPVISSNASNYSALTFLIKPSAKFSVKGDLYLQHDRFTQERYDQTTIVLPSGTIEQSQKQNIHKNILDFRNTLSANYIFNPKNQLLLGWQNFSSNENDNSDVSVQNTDAKELYVFRPRQYSTKLLFTHLFSKYEAFTVNGEYHSTRGAGSYTLSPSNYSSFFYKNITAYGVEQREMSPEKLGAIDLSYIRKKDKTNFSLRLTGNTRSVDFFNSIQVNSPVTYLVNPDSTNNSRIETRIIKLSANMYHPIGRSFNINYGIDAGLADISNEQGMHQNYSTRFILPKLGLSYEFSQIDRMQISYNYDNEMPKLKSIVPGYYIQGLTSLSIGADSFYIANRQTAQFIYSHIDLLDKQFLLFCGITYAKMPQLFLADLQPNYFYNITAFKPTSRSNQNISVFMRCDKFFTNLNNKLSPEINLVFGDIYTSQNGRELKTSYTQANFGLTAQMKYGKTFFSTTLNYMIQSQEQNNVRSVSRQYKAKASITTKITPEIFFGASFNYLSLHSPNRPAASLFLTDLEILRNSKNEKWTFSIKAMNLFDQQQYSQTYFLPTQQKTINYYLFPRVAMLSARYSF